MTRQTWCFGCPRIAFHQLPFAITDWSHSIDLKLYTLLSPIVVIVVQVATTTSKSTICREVEMLRRLLRDDKKIVVLFVRVEWYYYIVYRKQLTEN